MDVTAREPGYIFVFRKVVVGIVTLMWWRTEHDQQFKATRNAGNQKMQSSYSLNSYAQELNLSWAEAVISVVTGIYTNSIDKTSLPW